MKQTERLLRDWIDLNSLINYSKWWWWNWSNYCLSYSLEWWFCYCFGNTHEMTFPYVHPGTGQGCAVWILVVW